MTTAPPLTCDADGPCRPSPFQSQQRPHHLQQSQQEHPKQRQRRQRQLRRLPILWQGSFLSLQLPFLWGLLLLLLPLMMIGLVAMEPVEAAEAAAVVTGVSSSTTTPSSTLGHHHHLRRQSSQSQQEQSRFLQQPPPPEKVIGVYSLSVEQLSQTELVKAATYAVDQLLILLTTMEEDQDHQIEYYETSIPYLKKLSTIHYIVRILEAIHIQGLNWEFTVVLLRKEDNFCLGTISSITIFNPFGIESEIISFPTTTENNESILSCWMAQDMISQQDLELLQLKQQEKEDQDQQEEPKSNIEPMESSSSTNSDTTTTTTTTRISSNGNGGYTSISNWSNNPKLSEAAYFILELLELASSSSSSSTSFTTTEGQETLLNDAAGGGDSGSTQVSSYSFFPLEVIKEEESSSSSSYYNTIPYIVQGWEKMVDDTTNLWKVIVVLQQKDKQSTNKEEEEEKLLCYGAFQVTIAYHQEGDSSSNVGQGSVGGGGGSFSVMKWGNEVSCTVGQKLLQKQRQKLQSQSQEDGHIIEEDKEQEQENEDEVKQEEEEEVVEEEDELLYSPILDIMTNPKVLDAARFALDLIQVYAPDNKDVSSLSLYSFVPLPNIDAYSLYVPHVLQGWQFRHRQGRQLYPTQEESIGSELGRLGITGGTDGVQLKLMIWIEQVVGDYLEEDEEEELHTTALNDADDDNFCYGAFEIILREVVLEEPRGEDWSLLQWGKEISCTTIMTQQEQQEQMNSDE